VALFTFTLLPHRAVATVVAVTAVILIGLGIATGVLAIIG
jgi:hypothetical protein